MMSRKKGGPMRSLDISDRNRLVMEDSRIGVDIELFYRNPNPLEEISYRARLSEGNEIEIARARLNFGLNILTGFREGDFKSDGKPISCKKGSPNYCKDWKGLLRETAADLIRVFACAIFENSRVIPGAEKDSVGDNSGQRKMTIFDSRSASNIELWYGDSMPEEETVYKSKHLGLKDMMRARLHSALATVSGFREGDFGLKGNPISSDKGSCRYHRKWKKLLEEKALDLLLIFTETVFEGKIGVENIQSGKAPFKGITSFCLPETSILAGSGGEIVKEA
jgi:hypothetical protein